MHHPIFTECTQFYYINTLKFFYESRQSIHHMYSIYNRIYKILHIQLIHFSQNVHNFVWSMHSNFSKNLDNLYIKCSHQDDSSLSYCTDACNKFCAHTVPNCQQRLEPILAKNNNSLQIQSTFIWKKIIQLIHKQQVHILIHTFFWPDMKVHLLPSHMLASNKFTNQI